MINSMIAGILPYMPKKLVWMFSKEYIAGETIEEAIVNAKKLNAEGIMTTIDILGEFITTLDEAEDNKNEYLQVIEAAEAAGVKTQVGFNYLMNPMLNVAREMIAAGELGEIYSYRGVHAEDYMADPNGAWTFRHDPVGGGALADIGSHALATAEFLLGPISQVMGDCRTLIPVRKDSQGNDRKVEVDDVSHAFVQFEAGITGTIEANWVATGRSMQHDFEIYGSKGSLHFSQERFNELHYFSTSDAIGRGGFRRIEASPAHAPYGDFCVAPGHQIGFNDLKAIEIKGYAEAIAGLAPEPFNFRAGYRIQSLVEAIHTSSREKVWVITN